MLPTAFGECLKSLLNRREDVKENTLLELAQRRLAMYSLEEIWSATLLLAPIEVNNHWVLVAVTNPFKALPHQSSISVPDVLPGELKPDREPFTMLLFNSAPLYEPKTVRKIPNIMRNFLGFSWQKLKSSSLEFVDCFTVRVSYHSTSS